VGDRPSVLVWRRGRWSLRLGVRELVAASGGTLALLALAVAAMLLGDLHLPLADVLRALAGHGDPLSAYFVTDVRLPRVVGAVTLGAGLGVAGALLQTVSGNPLGSPDLIGFTAGSATGAVMAIVLAGGGVGTVVVGSLAGGTAAALLIGVLAARHGLTGQRLVLVGIAVGATLTAVDRLLLARADLATAQDAAQWLAGSLDGLLWHRCAPAANATAVLLVAAATLSRPLRMLTLGDDVAAAAGVAVPLTRAGALALAVGLVAVATATAGPVAFVALAAPQIARRLAHGTGPAMVGSALTGAVLVLASDIAAQRLFAPTQLAVGVVTGAAGGVYLVALLALQWRRSR
jgi:iron complex transport system permease protein